MRVPSKFGRNRNYLTYIFILGEQQYHSYILTWKHLWGPYYPHSKSLIKIRDKTRHKFASESNFVPALQIHNTLRINTPPPRKRDLKNDVIYDSNFQLTKPVSTYSEHRSSQHSITAAPSESPQSEGGVLEKTAFWRASRWKLGGVELGWGGGVGSLMATWRRRRTVLKSQVKARHSRHIPWHLFSKSCIHMVCGFITRY